MRLEQFRATRGFRCFLCPANFIALTSCACAISIKPDKASSDLSATKNRTFQPHGGLLAAEVINRFLLRKKKEEEVR